MKKNKKNKKKLFFFTFLKNHGFLFFFIFSDFFFNSSYRKFIKNDIINFLINDNIIFNKSILKLLSFKEFKTFFNNDNLSIFYMFLKKRFFILPAEDIDDFLAFFDSFLMDNDDFMLFYTSSFFSFLNFFLKMKDFNLMEIPLDYLQFIHPLSIVFVLNWNAFNFKSKYYRKFWNKIYSTYHQVNKKLIYIFFEFEVLKNILFFLKFSFKLKSFFFIILTHPLIFYFFLSTNKSKKIKNLVFKIFVLWRKFCNKYRYIFLDEAKSF